ncbi:MAG: cytochrome c3 family protein [Phycisphaerales bacterium JB039]
MNTTFRITLISLLLAAGAATIGAAGPGQAAPPAPQPPTGAGALAAAAPQRGPAVVIMDELVHYYGPVLFDHALHESMCEFTGRCDNCHHEQEEGEAIAACVTCHRLSDFGSTESQPSLKAAYHRQCLDCHRDWSGANGCGFCHTEVTAEAHSAANAFGADFGTATMRRLRVQPTFVYQTERAGVPVVTFHHADHTEVFGVACIDCHEGQSCTQCHGPRATSPRPSREQSCMGCHAERSCVFCHDVAPRPRFQHAVNAGWSLDASHASVACAECHGPGTNFTAPTSDFCRDCHRGAPGVGFDHIITGVPLSGSHADYDCLACHYGGTAAAPACDRCHEGRSYPEYLPGAPLPRTPGSIALHASHASIAGAAH